MWLLFAFLDHARSDIDQWSKVTKSLGTPPPEFFEKLQPEVGRTFHVRAYVH